MYTVWTGAPYCNTNQTYTSNNMKRIGQTPEFGIAAAQPGLFVSSVDFTPSCETYEQKDHKGEIIGLCLYGQKVNFSMEGEVPIGGDFSYGMGTELDLANSCPDSLWIDGQAPAATTMVVTASPYKRSRDGAATASVTGVIYPFGTATA